MALSFGRLALMTTLLAPIAACQGIAGTSAFEACDECGAGGGGGAGGAGATSTGTGATGTGTTGTGTGSTGTGTATCAEVTVTVEAAVGDVRIEIDPDDVDYDAGTTQTHCLPFGSKTISAECDPDDGDRYPLDVDWGNALCARGSSCTFDLAEPQTFVVSGAACE